MAALDYTIRGAINPMCPNAFLEGAMPLSADPISVSIFRMQHITRDLATTPDVRIGQGVMIQDEILKVLAFSDTALILARGCADTIPQEHTDGAMVWFFDGYTGTDQQEYTDGQIIGVKPLPTTLGGSSVAISGVPPTQLIFNSRQIRPYAPGKLRCDGQPWYTQATVDNANPALDFTWEHRNRISQHDVLVSHDEAGAALETDASYTIRVLSSTGTERAVYDSITDNNWSYTLTQAQTDYGITPGTGPAYIDGIIEIKTVRDGHDSWMLYQTPIRISSEIPA